MIHLVSVFIEVIIVTVRAIFIIFWVFLLVLDLYLQNYLIFVLYIIISTASSTILDQSYTACISYINSWSALYLMNLFYFSVHLFTRVAVVAAVIVVSFVGCFYWELMTTMLSMVQLYCVIWIFIHVYDKATVNFGYSFDVFIVVRNYCLVW